jgi:hypothetical protein
MAAAEPIAWNRSTPAFVADPHPFLARLRREAPVYAHPVENGRTEWMITRHRDCVAVLRDPGWSAEKFPSALLETIATDPQAPFSVVARTVLHMMLVKDGTDHARLRGLVNKAFTPRAIAELRPRVQAIADELLDAAERRGELDAIADLGMPLPLIAIAELLGVPLEDRALLKRWSDALVTFLDGSIRERGLADAARACVEIRSYLERVFAERRARPRDDLISRLLGARDVDDRLSHDELLGSVVLMLAAGHETTTSLIGNGLYTLLRHPDELAKLRAHPELVAPAIEELLRFEPPVSLTSRIPLGRRPRLLFGREISGEDEVSLVFSAANRDPEVFPDPDRLDLARGDSRHLAFGFGAHFCLGAALARLEGQIAIGSAVARFPGMKLARETAEWRPGYVLRGLVSLPLKL